MIKIILTINHDHCITLVLLDIMSTKHDHRWIPTLWTCSCVCGTDANFRHISITLNWLVILLSSLNLTTLFSSLT